MNSIQNGTNLNLKWSDIKNVEYLTDGGHNWIHTGLLNNRPVCIKQLKPEQQDRIGAMDEIENELRIQSSLDHRNIVSFIGAGYDKKGARFIVLERLDGGTLAQMLGYDIRIRDRRRRFFRKNPTLPYITVLKYGQQIAAAMDYLHRNAIEDGMLLHRDLKPDNIGFSLDRTVKLFDFGLSTILPNTQSDSDELYELSGECGSVRYMAPEVAKGLPYNHKADVYSFSIIFWEIAMFEKPFDGLKRDAFFEKVVHGGMRPDLPKKLPKAFADLLVRCWDEDPAKRPTFQSIMLMIADMIGDESAKKVNKASQKDNRRGGGFMKSLKNTQTSWF